GAHAEAGRARLGAETGRRGACRLPPSCARDWSAKAQAAALKSRGRRLRLRFTRLLAPLRRLSKRAFSMEKTLTLNKLWMTCLLMDVLVSVGYFRYQIAEARIHGAAVECADDRFEMFNNSCYLFVGYPEVTWQTARQTCRDKKAELASIHSIEEQNFVTATIRKSTEYSTSAIYWLGGMQLAQLPPPPPRPAARRRRRLDPTARWKWSDGSPMSFSAWLPGELEALGASGAEGVGVGGAAPERCLGVQWTAAPLPLLPSGLYWRPQRCSAVGGYVCKRINQLAGSSLSLNRTVNGSEGFLTSQNYPANYNHNLDYWVQLVGPERTRLVVQFSRIDLEPQQDCLYDFVELRSGGPPTDASARADDARDARDAHAVRWCGSHDTDMERFHFVSWSNEATLRFHSDYSQAGAGFAAAWKAVDVSGCPQLTLTAREGELTSPNFPDFLMARLDCNTTILAPPGRKVWLEFTDFDLGERGAGVGAGAGAGDGGEGGLGGGGPGEAAHAPWRWTWATGQPASGPSKAARPPDGRQRFR
ncbi:Putative CTL10 isoform B, partial [Gryllus bimaculatus]